MGVLNFNNAFRPFPQRARIDDIGTLSLNGSYVHDEPVHTPNVPNATEQNSPRVRRKRTKSGGKSEYNFKDYGVDERRRGSKHQRRKQNFNELQELVGSDDPNEEIALLETQMTAFAELLLDESKMKAWDRFIGLSEDKQGEYIEEIDEFHSNRPVLKNNKQPCSEEEYVKDKDDSKFMSIDKKIRDVLRSKQLAHDVNGLLNYYEEDVNSCLNDVTGPAILVMDIEDAYDRMLVYAVCQYNKLHATTMKLSAKTLVEIELEQQRQQQEDEMNDTRGSTLTEYLLTHPPSSRT